MAPRQVTDILVRLGIEGLTGLDKVSSAFKDLQKTLDGPTTSAIERVRRSINEYGNASARTEQLIKGQLEALRGLRTQADITSETYRRLGADINKLEAEVRGTTAAIDQQRQAVLASTSASDRNADALRRQIQAFAALQQQTRPGSSAFVQLGRDIETARTRLTGLTSEAQQFTRTLSAGFGATPERLAGQISILRRGMAALRFDSEEYLQTLERIQLLSITQAGRTGRANVIAGFRAYESPVFTGGYADPSRLPDLPNTTAALEQQLSELTAQLNNVERGSADYTRVSIQMAAVQRELRTELLGTAEAFNRLNIAQEGAERRATKLQNIQEYYRTQGPMAPGVGGFRDPVTGAIIARGARTPGRVRVDEQAYGQPIGPAPFPEAARRAEENIQRSLDDVNKIYENARVQRAEIQSKYDNLHIEKLLEGLDLEGRLRQKSFEDELAAFDRQMAARDQKRRSRISPAQAVQTAGAVISGGIFGGPEGFLGGLGGAALGAAIPGLGIVGGAFAGSAAGAQVGMFRQQLAAAADYAAEIRRLQLALQGVVYSFDDYRAALSAISSTSNEFNVPIQQSTQQFTKLAAAVIGSGGTVKDAENTFKGLTASVLATGGSIQDINGALVAAAQVFSKGKLTAEELRGQIGERLAGAFSLFAESSGKSTQQLDKDLQNGEVTLAQFVEFVEFSLKKYGRTAQIIADSPEQAGARLDRALKNLQKNVGDALGPTGAAFQDFAASSIRGLDRLINKLIELKMIQPGAGYYQELVLGGQMSVASLEKRLAEAGARESELLGSSESSSMLKPLRKSLVASLFFPEIKEATKEARILEEALIKIRQIEKETNKERKQRAAEENKAEQERLGQQYLQILEQKEQALADARRQREEQIAKIRKDAIEASLRLERDLGDERRNIEQDIQRVRREMEFGAGEIDRLRRLAAGEDPEAIEAERRAAEISQKAIQDKVKIQEDFLDKELQQQRTIADFQKNIAKQIADANEGYANRIGQIQRDFSRDSAKIIEEGSGKAAKKITLAAQIVSQVLQRSALNQQRAQYGLQPIGEPTGFRDGRPVYGQMSSEQVPDQIQRIDSNLEQLLRKLQESPRQQGSLPGRQISSSDIGEQFFSMLSADSGYEDVAGLQPLPIEKMRRQAARPLRMFWEQVEGMTQGIYAVGRKEAQKYLQQDRFDLPAARQKVLKNIQRVESFRSTDKWDPADLQWQERQNRWSPAPRSKPGTASLETFSGIARTISNDLFKSLNQMNTSLYGVLDDISDYLNENQIEVLRKGVREQLRQGVSPAEIERSVTGGNARTGRGNVRSAIKNLLNEVSGPSPNQRILSPLDQPYIIPGVENQFEGAMLDSNGFGVSKLSRNFGSLATAGLLSGLLPAAGATTEIRRKGVEQQMQQIDQNQLRQQLEIMSNITQSSRDTNKNLKEQSREIELQIEYLTRGHEPAVARELANLQQSYEIQKRRLQLQAGELIERGANEELINSQLALELATLDTLNKQNEALTLGNEKQRNRLEQVTELKQLYTDIGMSIKDGVVSAIQGAIDGTKTLQEVASDLLRSIANRLLDVAINLALFGTMSGTGKGGGLLGFLFKNAMGNAYAKNGIVPFAYGGVVDRPTLFPFAKGIGLMGEAGPEAILPLRRGRDGKLGVTSSGNGNVVVNVSVDASGSSVQGDDQQANQLGRVVAIAVQQEMIKQKRPGGLLA